MSAAVETLRFNRWNPEPWTIDFQLDEDWSADEFRMHIRRFPDIGGEPLVDLDTAVEGAEGIYCTATEQDILVGGVELAMMVSTVVITIDPATVNALPFTNPLGGDVELYYDMERVPDEGPAQRVLEGVCVIHAGVTQPETP